jgi:hypothetical protein
MDKKKAGDNTGLCPLRHIGSIAIWEGNYTSDILNIGRIAVFFNKIYQNQRKIFSASLIVFNNGNIHRHGNAVSFSPLDI